MQWNNPNQNGKNYRAMIRLAFAIAIISSIIMAVFDNHQDSDPTVSQERIASLKTALDQKLDHDQYIKISVSERQILLRCAAQSLTDQLLKSRLDQLSDQVSALQKQTRTQLPIYLQNYRGQIIAQIKPDHSGWYRSQKGLKVKTVFGTQ